MLQAADEVRTVYVTEEKDLASMRMLQTLHRALEKIGAREP